jgi:hypothetical protein
MRILLVNFYKISSLLWVVAGEDMPRVSICLRERVPPACEMDSAILRLARVNWGNSL